MSKREVVRHEASRLAQLAAPITFAILLELAPSIVTTMLVGRASGDDVESVLAASSLADFFQSLIPVNVTFGLGAAVATLCSRAYGADHHEQFWLLAQAGLLASAYSAVPIAILSVNGASILKVVGQEAQLAHIAQTFIWIGLASLPFAMIFTIARSALQAQDIAAPFVAASLVATLVSLPLGYVLGEYTPLGYVGVALSTLVSSMLKACIAVPVVLRNESFRTAWPGWQWRQAHQLVCSSWRVALGSVLMTTFQSAGYMTITILCGHLPDAALQIAASGIGSSFISFSFIPMMGVSSAGTVRIGTALGANDPTRASLAAAVMHGAMAVVAALAIVVFALLAQPYASAYTSDAETIALAASLARYLLPLLPLVALAGSLQGVFQACSAQWACAALNCAFLLVTSVGVGYLWAFPLHGGLRGLWNGQMIGFAGLIVASAVWYKRLDWTRQAEKASSSPHDMKHRLSRAVSVDLACSPDLGSVVFMQDRRLSSTVSDVREL